MSIYVCIYIRTCIYTHRYASSADVVFIFLLWFSLVYPVCPIVARIYTCRYAVHLAQTSLPRLICICTSVCACMYIMYMYMHAEYYKQTPVYVTVYRYPI